MENPSKLSEEISTKLENGEISLHKEIDIALSVHNVRNDKIINIGARQPNLNQQENNIKTIDDKIEESNIPKNEEIVLFVNKTAINEQTSNAMDIDRYQDMAATENEHKTIENNPTTLVKMIDEHKIYMNEQDNNQSKPDTGSDDNNEHVLATDIKLQKTEISHEEKNINGSNNTSTSQNNTKTQEISINKEVNDTNVEENDITENQTKVDVQEEEIKKQLLVLNTPDDDYTYKSYSLRTRKKKSAPLMKTENSTPAKKRKSGKTQDDYEVDETSDLMECPHCEYVGRKRFFKNHLRTHITQLSCSICNNTFQSNDELIEHKQSHKNEVLNCEKCSLEFTDHKEYLIHTMDHIKRSIYECQECKGEFSNRNAFISHIRVHFDGKYECDICKKKLKGELNLKLHMRTHTVTYDCKECGRICRTSELLKYHMIDHTGVKLIQCFYCGRGFKNEHQRKIHMRIHTNERPYQCKVCFKKFIQQTDFKRHELTHSKEKTFVCDYCDKKFLQKLSMQQHMRSHTKTTMYKCPDCPMQCITKGSLKSHILYHHTDVRRYKCDYCNMDFKQKEGLTRHNRSQSHRNKKYAAMKKAQG